MKKQLAITAVAVALTFSASLAMARMGGSPGGQHGAQQMTQTQHGPGPQAHMSGTPGQHMNGTPGQHMNGTPGQHVGPGPQGQHTSGQHTPGQHHQGGTQTPPQL
jgi:hypothetical protein